MSRSSVMLLCLGIWIGVSAGLTRLAAAQSGVPAPVIPGAPLPAAPAAPRTLWSSLGLSSASLHACRDKLCASQIGQMANGMLMPMGALTGGMIPTICPLNPKAAGLADQAALTGGPAGPAGAQAAAAAAQADVAGAGARIAAIEYLATLDCHYWPDAEAALIGRLRGDRVECVRFAAARALGSGCCCSKKTIEALQLVVAGEDKDGFPSETSERVRAAATAALQNCLTRMDGRETAPEKPVPPEPATPRPPEPPGTGTTSPFGPRVSQRPQGALGYYETTVAARSLGQVKTDARRILTLAQSQGVGKHSMTTGNRSLYGALARAFSPSSRSNPDHPVVNLEHVDIAQTRQATIKNRPWQVDPAKAGVSVDRSLTRANDPDADSPRPQRSLLHVLRRSLRHSAESGPEERVRPEP